MQMQQNIFILRIVSAFKCTYIQVYVYVMAYIN